MVTEEALRLRPRRPIDRSRALVCLPNAGAPTYVGVPRPPAEMVTFMPGFRPGLRVLKLD